jgi:hypothetical protein
MTAARRLAKRPLRPIWLARAGAAVLLALGALAAATPPRAAATTERIVVDRHTGLAIHGFDPVAYFTDAKATIGREELELSLGGAVWRFRNPGNRAAFAEYPDIYMPRFGGYDPVAVARGVATAGHPHLWVIADDRLYLFHSVEAQGLFAADPDGAIVAAEARWAELESTLLP